MSEGEYDEMGEEEGDFDPSQLTPEQFAQYQQMLQERMMAEGGEEYGEEYGDEYGEEYGEEYAEGGEEYGEEYSGEYGEEGETSDPRRFQEGQDVDASDMNFDSMPEFAGLPPLDEWRKVKKEILSAINSCRAEEGKNAPPMFLDLLATEACQEYALKVIEDDEDETLHMELVKKSQIIGTPQNLCATTLLDDDSNDPHKLIESFLDANGLLFELNRDLVLTPDTNHVGIGTFVHDMKLAITLTFTSKALGVSAIVQGSDGDQAIIQIKGKMFKTDVGIFAVRIVTPDLKEVRVIGPQDMELARDTQIFTVEIKGEEITYTSDKRPTFLLEFYTRQKPETIPYRQPSDEKVNVKHVVLVHRMPLTHYPDPRQQYEDMKEEDLKAAMAERARELEEEKKRQEEEEMKEREAIKEEQRRLLQEAEKDRLQQKKMEEQQAKEEGASSKSVAQSSQRAGLKSGKSSASHLPSSPQARSQSKSIPASDQSKEFSPRSGESQDVSADEMDGSPQQMEQREMTVEQEKQRLMEDLERAKRVKEEYSARNLKLQRQIVQMRQRSEVTMDRQGDSSTTENKYMNTLANLQEVKKKLLHVKEQYNSWTTKHEENLYEKQARCEEIKEYFRDFKREVAKGAEFNKNGKSIPEHMIAKWEREEIEKDKEVQEYRITNIKLKNKLAKLEKEIRDKEKLADGLQLIDYEQLKIENQTLNEKIEERNEELHKLNKKIISTVHILTHIREKLHFVTAQKAKLSTEFEVLQSQLNKEREALNKLKKEKEDFRAENQKRRQETGIANSKLLTEDLELRTEKVKVVEETIRDREKQLFEMTDTVKRANTLKMTAAKR